MTGDGKEALLKELLKRQTLYNVALKEGMDKDAELQRETNPTSLMTKPQVSNIGDILLSSGKISHDALERIIALHKQEGILFGEAAIKLGLVTEEDVTWALASQYSYPYIRGEDTTIAREVVAVHQPFSLHVESFRSIRSGIMPSGAGSVTKT
ncbi:MAG: hypothetical protein HZC12_03060, partial [Nitrospirae bacterium]|nr:hypothetical protein [Nitrospirota bacterium]